MREIVKVFGLAVFLMLVASPAIDAQTAKGTSNNCPEANGLTAKEINEIMASVKSHNIVG